MAPVFGFAVALLALSVSRYRIFIVICLLMPLFLSTNVSAALVYDRQMLLLIRRKLPFVW